MTGEKRLEEALALYQKEEAAAGRKAPFKFLDAYEKQDREIFFGRNAETDDLRRRYYKGRTLVVYGESGSGKTSLIQCGLGNAIPDEDAEFVYARSNVDPIQALKERLHHGKSDQEKSLIELIRARADATSKTQVLVFDQLEELFVFQPPSARKRFYQTLAQALDQKLDMKLIFSIREEYFAHLTEVEQEIPEIFENRYWLKKMGTHEARQVIEAPCQKLGVGLDQGLAEAILGRLQDLRNEIDLPYLQIILDRLYRKAEARGGQMRLLAADLQALGEMGDILFSFLEEQVNALVEPDMGRDLLKCFVTAERTRRPMDVEAAHERLAAKWTGSTAEAVRALLLGFVEARILRQEGADAPFELRHDTLAAGIARWLTPMEEEVLKIRALVENRLNEHRAGGGLIDSDELLRKIEPYVPHLGLGDEARDFLARSRRHVDAARRRRRIALAAITTAIVIVLAGLTGWALFQKSRAQEAEKRAKQSESEARTAESDAKEKTKRMIRMETRALVARAKRTVNLVTQNLEEKAVLLWTAARPEAGEDGEKAATSQGFISLVQQDFPKTLGPHKDSVSVVVFSPDGKLIATGSDDKTAKLWRVDTGELLRTVEAHKESVESVAFSTDGKLLVTQSKTEPARLWKVATGELIRAFRTPKGLYELSPYYYGRCNTVAFSPDGELIATRVLGFLIGLWRIENGEFLGWITHKDPVCSVAFSPDGRLIAIGSQSGFGPGKAELWQVETRKLLRTFNVLKDCVNSVAFSPDGKLLATGSRDLLLKLKTWPEDKTDVSIKLWRVKTGALLRNFEEYQTLVESVAFSPDGELLATGSNEAPKLWRVETGELLRTIKGHEEFKDIKSVAFSPDGKLLATGSEDKTAKLWRVDSDELIRAIKERREENESVDNSPGGKLVKAGSKDETAKTSKTQDHSPTLREVWMAFAEKSNLRVCRGTYDVVPVTPYPGVPETDEEVWAPEKVCQAVEWDRSEKQKSRELETKRGKSSHKAQSGRPDAGLGEKLLRWEARKKR